MYTSYITYNEYAFVYAMENKFAISALESKEPFC